MQELQLCLKLSKLNKIKCNEIPISIQSKFYNQLKINISFIIRLCRN